MASPTDFINQAASYANGLLNSAQGALAAAQAVIIPTEITDGFAQSPDINLPSPPADPGDPNVPDIQSPNEAPNVPVSLADIGGINPGQAPTFIGERPNLALPNQPVPLPEFTGSPPIINTNVVFPDPPSALDAPVIAPPVIADRPMPVKPSVTLPVFSANAPTNAAVAPTDLAGEMREHYRNAVPEMVTLLEGQVDAMIARYNPQYHQQMGLIESRLQRLMAGGSGIDTAVESAIYERARDKGHAEYRRLHDGAWDDAAARGFTLPTGTLLKLQFSARLALADANARASQDIAIKQAEMEQQNLQFAITTSSALRTTILNAAMGYHQSLVSINGQALEAAKTVAGLVLEAYNAKVKEFELQLDAYKVEAAVFETRLKGATAAIDLYRAEIEALQAMTQVDVAKIGMYESRVKVLGVLADVYRSRIAAAQSRAEMEKLKIDLFQSQVQTYTAQVQAKNAEWQGYQAAIGGEEAKARIFSEQVRAYSAQVDGYRANVDAQAEIVRAKVSVNQNALALHESSLKAYSAQVDAQAQSNRAKVDAASVRLSFKQASYDNQVKYFQSMLDWKRTNIESTTQLNTAQLNARIANAQNQIEAQKATAQLSLGVGEAYSSVAQAALAGLNSIVSLNEDVSGSAISGG